VTAAAATQAWTPGDMDRADIDLVRLARAGDAEAFGALVEKHRRAVYRAAFAALRSPDEAEDVAQDTFITAFQKLDAFRGEAAFKTWILSIAWRKALDRRRHVTRWLKLMVTRDDRDDAQLDIVEQAPSRERTQEDALGSVEFQRTLKRLIAKLPPKLRDTLLLSGSGDHSYDEIARMLGVPVGTVKWRVSEARRVLKQKMQALGYSYE
jgi:RNA polymerase sigma-70 factor (ECF subfamily)